MAMLHDDSDCSDSIKFQYSSSVLNDGLMLELRDAIKTQMLMLKDLDKLFQACKPRQLCKGHISNVPSPGTLTQVGKSRNIHGQLSHNISLDLHMKHTDKKLKECSEALEQMFLGGYLFNQEDT